MNWKHFNAVAGIFAMGALQAQVISFNFSGVVTYLSNPGNQLPSDIVLGTPFSGTVTYEASRLTDTFPGDLNNGVYRFENAALNDLQFTATVGSHVFTSLASAEKLPDYIQVYKSESRDYLDYGTRQVLLDGAPLPVTFNGNSMSVTAYDYQKNALANDSLLLAPPSPELFEQMYFAVTGSGIGGSQIFRFGGDITSLTAVPEPMETAAMMAAGLVGFGIWRRWRRQ